MLSHKGFFLLLIIFSVLSCAPDISIRKKTPPVQEKQPLTVQEQQNESLKIFKRILEVRKSTKTLEEAIRKIEPMYLEIIEKYPQAPLAQESCLRLIELYLRDYTPPAIEKAENIYKTFMERYPQSRLRATIERTLTKFFYSRKMWKRIIELHRERIKSFIETGNIDDPYYLFVFSEARYNTGNISEAVKGYKWIIKKFPDSHDAKLSERRLKEILLKDKGEQ
jgi:outer membrane protein assembly factor BamD (BamD/ComL family)